MKVLIAPLNWGLGHAARCIPLVIRYLRNGDDVTLAGDGDSLLLIRKHFPNLPYRRLAPLTIRYSAGNRQVGAMIRALPGLIRWARKDHTLLESILREESFDLIISDNRFGCFAKGTKCVYITHQLHIMLPKPWRWLEPFAERLHSRLARHYSETWVPDYPDEPNLSGALSHHVKAWQRHTVRYIGPLSRFADISLPNKGDLEGLDLEGPDTVALLSGPEPQRTLLEQQVIRDWQAKQAQVLIVRGTMSAPPTNTRRGHITLVPYLGDELLAQALLGAKTIIARSGYSTIMDLAALGVLDKATLIPTPGQPEQEYLGQLKVKS